MHMQHDLSNGERYHFRFMNGHSGEKLLQLQCCIVTLSVGWNESLMRVGI